MNINYYNPYVRDELYHHGIFGMKWGKKNGPPYPLDASDHSASEKKASWRKSLDNDGVSKTKAKKHKKESGYKRTKREYKESRARLKAVRKEYREAKKLHKMIGTSESNKNLRLKKEKFKRAKRNYEEKATMYGIKKGFRNAQIELGMGLALAATPSVISAGMKLFNDYAYKTRPDVVSTSSREFRNAMDANYMDYGNLPAVANRRK